MRITATFVDYKVKSAPIANFPKNIQHVKLSFRGTLHVLILCAATPLTWRAGSKSGCCGGEGTAKEKMAKLPGQASNTNTKDAYLAFPQSPYVNSVLSNLLQT